GVPATLNGSYEFQTIEKKPSTLIVGPVASQVAIKQLGTNGGGFYSANSAHPLENPTAFSNLLETFAILLIPAALVFMFGDFIRSKKHGYLLFFVMLSLWL